MKFGPVPLERAEGRILGHNIAGRDGRRLFRKGKVLTADQLAVLRDLGRREIYVAELEPGDVNEDEAAQRVAEACQGPGLRLSSAATGRVNLLATAPGLFRVDAVRLQQLNQLEGITVAVLSAHTTVRRGQTVATVKIIPYALPERTVVQAEAVVGSERLLLRVDPLRPQAVGLILSGSPSSREKLFEEFSALEERVRHLGSHVSQRDYVTLDEDDAESVLTATLSRQLESGVRLILLAGQTAIMDRGDIVPRAVERAGGHLECVGAPVDPGNLLMVGYIDDVPVLGAPGCARSRKANVVDWVLPRLLAAEHLSRADIVSLGHGGLLEDVPERPLPRSRIG